MLLGLHEPNRHNNTTGDAPNACTGQTIRTTRRYTVYNVLIQILYYEITWSKHKNTT